LGGHRPCNGIRRSGTPDQRFQQARRGVALAVCLCRCRRPIILQLTSVSAPVLGRHYARHVISHGCASSRQRRRRIYPLLANPSSHLPMVWIRNGNRPRASAWATDIGCSGVGVASIIDDRKDRIENRCPGESSISHPMLIMTGAACRPVPTNPGSGAARWWVRRRRHKPAHPARYSPRSPHRTPS
jgi:hypothetical protein